MADEILHKQEFHIRNLTTRTVTLFPTRAQIVRDIKEIILQSGINQVTIYGLSPTVDQHSIKVEGTGSAKVTDVKVDLLPNREAYEDIYPSESDDDNESDEESDVEIDDIKTINEKLKNLNFRVQEEQEKINSAASRLRFCEAFGNSIHNDRPAAKELGTFIQTYQDEREKVYAGHEEATKEIENLKAEISKTEKEKLKVAKAYVKENEKAKKEKARAKEKRLRIKAEKAKEKQRIKAERESFWPKKVYCITINLEPEISTPGSSRRSSIDGDTIVEHAKPANLATSEFHETSSKALKAGEVNISLSYITYGASWTPRYDLSLNTVKCSGLLEYGAELINTTSETWRDAKMVLSTSQASFSGLTETIPQLLPWHVRLQKGGLKGDSSLFSKYEVEAKKNEWSQSTGEQSQKPRWDIFGREDNRRDNYVIQEEQRMYKKKSDLRREAANYAEKFSAPRYDAPQQSQPPPNTGYGPAGLFGGTNARQQNLNIEQHSYAPTSNAFAAPQARNPAGNANFDIDELVMDFAETSYMPDNLRYAGAEPPPSLTFEEGAWEESGLTTTYEAPGTKTLAPSNSTIKHKIAKVEFKNIVFSHVVIGKLRQVAFLKARIRNTSKITLLKGPLGLTLDSSFLGQGSFPRCSSGETFSLPLGVDPSINVIYLKPTVRRSQTGIFSKEDTNVFTRSLTIVNTKPNAGVELTVLDQVPVSEDERLKIEIINPRGLKVGESVRAGQSALTALPASTLGKGTAKDVRASAHGMDVKEANWGSAVAAAKKGGEVSWNVKLNPGQGVKLVLEYEANFPGGETVVAV